jgi:hypothetical protein
MSGAGSGEIVEHTTLGRLEPNPWKRRLKPSQPFCKFEEVAR